MSDRAREPRRAAALAMVGVLVLLLALAWTVSAWFLVGVPFAVAGCCAMWAGLSNEEALEAFGAGDDVGRGPAGMSP